MKYIMIAWWTAVITFIILYGVVMLFDIRIVMEMWEDGSGVVGFYYCFPWDICF